MIKGLTDRTENQGRLAKAGNIRLGYKAKKCKNQKCGVIVHGTYEKCPECKKASFGNEFPREAEYFVLDDLVEKDPNIASILGENPTELKIFFPFNEVEACFPTSMNYWSASSMVCRGDGEKITYAINPQSGRPIIRDGVAIEDFEEDKHPYVVGEVIPCPGLDRNLYNKCQNCKPVGTLFFLLEEYPRLAYYQITTSSVRNIVTLTSQLRFVHEGNGGKLMGVPFTLRRVSGTTSAPKIQNGQEVGRQRVTKYFLELEVDPSYLAKFMAAQKQLANPFDNPLLLPTEVPDVDTFDGDFEDVEPEPEYPTKKEFIEKVNRDLKISAPVMTYVLAETGLINGGGYIPEQANTYWDSLATLGVDLHAFCEKVKEEIPYFAGHKTILDTLASLDLTYNPENEEGIYDELATLAECKADEAAAEQEGNLLKEEEEIPF